MCPQLFRKEIKRVERSKKIPKVPYKIENIHIDEKLQNVLFLSSACLKSVNAPCPIFDTNFKNVYIEHQYKLDPLLRMVTLPTPLTSPSSIKEKSQWPVQFPLSVTSLSTGRISINQFPSTISFPKPTLPRKPRRQSILGKYNPVIVGNKGSS